MMTTLENADVSFDNRLKKRVNVYFSYEIGGKKDRRKAFFNNGQPSSEIIGETKKGFGIRNLPRKFKLEIEIKDLPELDSKKAIKIVPGDGLGNAHHTELHLEKRNGDTIYVFKVHYEFNGKPKTHRDPTIIHPEAQGGQGE